MQSAEDGKEYALPPLRCATGAHPYPRPSACASHYSREHNISESGADAPRPRQLRGPHNPAGSTISRSAKPCCQGEAGAVGLSRMNRGKLSQDYSTHAESVLRMRLVIGTERRAQHSSAAHQKEGPDRASKRRTGDEQAASPCRRSDVLAMREKS